MISVKKIKNLRGKRVLVRVDFNVPVARGRVVDDSRIRAALPTLNFLRAAGAKGILISHIGREPKESLKPVAQSLKKHLPVHFVPEIFGPAVERALGSMKNGDVVLLENLRSDGREKEGNVAFARLLASYGDAYVNEAFPVSHRVDASIVRLPKLLPAYAGLQLEREVAHLSLALKPKHPFLFIQGGAKAETKLPLIKRFLKLSDAVFVGGELANDFLKAKGFSVGKSKIDKGASALIKPLLKNKKLLLPSSVVVARKSENTTISVNDIRSTEAAYDIGVSSIDELKALIQKAKLIVWNGPMGWYEGGYVKGTEEILKLLSTAPGTTIIAGGDTAVLVDRKKLSHKFTFVSTGGGATLEFLTKGTLPGIKALK